MEREIQIESGGTKVSLNSFAQRVVLGTILGLMGALHDVDVRGEIRIVVKPAAAPRS